MYLAMVGGLVGFLLVMGLWTRWNSSKQKVSSGQDGGEGETAGKERVCGELGREEGAVVVCPHLPLSLTTMEEEEEEKEEEQIPLEEIKLFYQSIEENTLRRKELRENLKRRFAALCVSGMS